MVSRPLGVIWTLARLPFWLLSTADCLTWFRFQCVDGSGVGGKRPAWRPALLEADIVGRKFGSSRRHSRTTETPPASCLAFSAYLVPLSSVWVEIDLERVAVPDFLAAMHIAIHRQAERLDREVDRGRHDALVAVLLKGERVGPDPLAVAERGENMAGAVRQVARSPGARRAASQDRISARITRRIIGCS